MGLLKWALIFFVIALIAGAFGFTGVAGASASMAKIMFGVFLAVAIAFAVIVMLGIGAASRPMR
jgi:uncharacterized membrane protein YtjA (UPF0391 family)